MQVSGQILLDSSFIRVDTLANSLYYPWEIIWGPDNSVWMSELGRIYRVNPETHQKNIILTINDYYQAGSRQTGLAIDPDFKTNQYLYLDYNYAGSDYYDYTYYGDQHATSNLYLKVVRYTYNVGSNTLENPVILLDGIKILDGYRDGGKLLISDDHIYLTIGDAKQVHDISDHSFMKSGTAPQDLDSFYGKILRLNMDGSVPHDNPFAKAPYDKTPHNLIWSYGHRHTQGLAVGKGNKLYYSEHGRNNDDEFGIIEKGMNYGWPLIEGFCDSLREQVSCDTILNHREPIHAWNPNVAPSNMEYVGDSPIPEFRNSVLVGTLTGDGYGNHIAVLSLNDDGSAVTNERIILKNEYGRIRDLCVSPVGDVYFITSNLQAGIFSYPTADYLVKISFDRFNVISGIENTIEYEMVLFPNPSGQERKIRVKFPDSTGIVQLYQSNGRLMASYALSEKEMVLDATSYASGIYLIRYCKGDRSVTKKMIIE